MNRWHLLPERNDLYMKILVTGGAGFIGSHVVDTYIKEGLDVVVIDNLSSGEIQNVNPNAKFYLMDIRSKELEKVFKIEKPDIVNHHAAQKSIPYSIENPIEDADINIVGLLNLLELCVKNSVRKFIYISSGGALTGDAKMIPTTESYIPTMISPYAISKFINEKYLYYYKTVHALNYIILRYANVYGPRQVANGECGVLPIFINNILANRSSMLFTYEDMPYGATRDYIFIDDICKANVIALDKGESEAFNIGSGEEIAIAELYDLIQEVAGSNLKLLRGRERVGDVRRSVLDCSKAKNRLGWTPSVNFREGIKITYDYYKNYRRLQNK